VAAWQPPTYKYLAPHTLLTPFQPHSQDFVITPEVVLTLMAQLESALAEWYANQAPETLKGRLTKEEFQVGWAVACGWAVGRLLA
jgi:hypothetical protein